MLSKAAILRQVRQLPHVLQQIAECVRRNIRGSNIHNEPLLAGYPGHGQLCSQQTSVLDSSHFDVQSCAVVAAYCSV